MSKNSQNLLQGARKILFTEPSNELISALGFVTLKTGTGKDIKDLKKAVSGDTVKKAFDELANNINEKFINKLNIMLKQEQDKVVSLQDIIGDTSRGLQKDLADLTAKLDSILPEEAPTHPDIL